jgi:hypothetical protein
VECRRSRERGVDQCGFPYACFSPYPDEIAVAVRDAFYQPVQVGQFGDAPNDLTVVGKVRYFLDLRPSKGWGDRYLWGELLFIFPAGSCRSARVHLGPRSFGELIRYVHRWP